MRIAAASLCLLLAACAAAPVAEPPELPLDPPPAAAPAAEPEETAPTEPRLYLRGDGPALPAADQALSRIALGAGADPARPLPILGAIAAADPELLLLAGDVVRAEAGAEARLPSLREAYGVLSMNAHFAAFNMAEPMLAAWGAAEVLPEDTALSERMFETFWRDAAVGRDHPGVYGARAYGPAGRRVQVLLLDLHTFRSPDTLLGEAQWAWLADQLQQPADLRLLVSPQSVHGSLSDWSRYPAERARLLQALQGRGPLALLAGDGEGVVRRDRRVELSTSSLNLAGPVSTFGLAEIDWSARSLTLSVHGLQGEVRSRLVVGFAALS